MDGVMTFSYTAKRSVYWNKFGKQYGIISKVEHMQTYDQLFHLPKYIFHKNVCTCAPKDKYGNIHISIIDNSPKLKICPSNMS